MKLIIKIAVKADGKTYSGDVTVPNDDGTTTLPMMVYGALRRLSEDHEEIAKSKTLMLVASVESSQ